MAVPGAVRDTVLGASIILLLAAIAVGVGAVAEFKARRDHERERAESRRLAHIDHRGPYHHGTCLDCMFTHPGEGT